MNKLIGLHGDAGCGKDEAGNCLVVNEGFVVDKFAMPMYQALAAMFGTTVEAVELGKRAGYRPDGIDLTYRELLQTLGTEWGRDIVHPELWVLRAQQRIAATSKNTVFTDVRFDNEAKMILQRGGMVFKIVRPGMEKISKSGHSSENGISDAFISDTIVNDEGINELHKKIRWLVRNIDKDLNFTY